jgi:hypothetical protein
MDPHLQTVSRRAGQRSSKPIDIYVIAVGWIFEGNVALFDPDLAASPTARVPRNYRLGLKFGLLPEKVFNCTLAKAGTVP